MMPEQQGGACDILIVDGETDARAFITDPPGLPAAISCDRAALERAAANLAIGESVTPAMAGNGARLPKESRAQRLDSRVTERGDDRGFLPPIAPRAMKRHSGVPAIYDAPPFERDTRCGTMSGRAFPCARKVRERAAIKHSGPT